MGLCIDDLGEEDWAIIDDFLRTNTAPKWMLGALKVLDYGAQNAELLALYGGYYGALLTNPANTGRGARLMDASSRIKESAGRKAFSGVASGIGMGATGLINYAERRDAGASVEEAAGLATGYALTTWGGAKAGAKGGALIGGAAGSIVPGVGTALGAGIGGVIGGVGGGVAASGIFRRVEDDVRSGAHAERANRVGRVDDERERAPRVYLAR